MCVCVCVCVCVRTHCRSKYVLCFFIFLCNLDDANNLNITKQMRIGGSSSICSAKGTNVAYISASVNIVKISILIVSRQRHSSWNRSLNALDVLKLCYSSE